MRYWECHTKHTVDSGYHLPHVARQSNNHNHDNHSASPRVRHNKRCWYSPPGGKPGYTREEVVRLVTAGANLPGGCPIDCWPLCSLCTVQYFCQTADSGHKSAIPVSYFIWPNNDCKQRIRTKTAACPCSVQAECCSSGGVTCEWWLELQTKVRIDFHNHGL